MWWGILLGIFFVGLLDHLPREVLIKALASRYRASGILRAIAAGIFFDLCSHGILMIGMKIYERGATIGQTTAFLLASPWNSLSLTLVLVSLIGIWYTLIFIFLSAVIAAITGWTFDLLVAQGHLPENPTRAAIYENVNDINLTSITRNWFCNIRFSFRGFLHVVLDGFSSSRTVLRWLLFGIVLASLLRAVMPTGIFAYWFGPTLLGIMLTAALASVVEICSEGSTPIAADFATKASAPGNSFTFLMAGVATDYTEVISLKDTTKSWKIALALPLITVPQVLITGMILNYVS